MGKQGRIQKMMHQPRSQGAKGPGNEVGDAPLRNGECASLGRQSIPILPLPTCVTTEAGNLSRRQPVLENEIPSSITQFRNFLLDFSPTVYQKRTHLKTLSRVEPLKSGYLVFSQTVKTYFDPRLSLLCLPCQRRESLGSSA